MELDIKILEHNIRRLEDQSYYFLRICFVFLCVGAALAVKFDLSAALIVICVTGLILVLSYGRGNYSWNRNSNIPELSKKVEKLRLKRMGMTRIVLVIGAFCAFTVDWVLGIVFGQQ